MEDLINEIYTLSKEWQDYKSDLNECAYTDSLIEIIINKADQLKMFYNKEALK